MFQNLYFIVVHVGALTTTPISFPQITIYIVICCLDLCIKCLETFMTR